MINEVTNILALLYAMFWLSIFSVIALIVSINAGSKQHKIEKQLDVIIELLKGDKNDKS